MTDLTILMPVFNERETVVRAIESALESELPVDGRELIVIDDGSTDGTAGLLDERDWPSDVRLLSHDHNLGKGAALRTGLKEARGEVTAILDADLEYQAADIGKLLPPLMDGISDAVYGVRGFRSHSAYSFWYVMGNRVVTFTANLLFNSWIDDIMTCHKVMRTDLLRSLDLRENGFAIEPEITARLLRAQARIYEVPVDYTARGRDSGKKLTAFDGVRVVRTLVRCRVGR
jgi:glycosyltransferase involved in cell wall biosynthesis